MKDGIFRAVWQIFFSAYYATFKMGIDSDEKS
jgi:hypothetical protein